MGTPRHQDDQNAATVKPPVWVRCLPVVLVLAGGAAYLNSFDGVFLFDDDKLIIKNDQIRNLLPIGDLLSNTRRPVVTVSLAINYTLGELNVWGYHAFNLAVHLLAGLALYGVVRRTAMRLDAARDNTSSTAFAAGIGLAVSLLWVVHPLQTQSVTYVIQRAESMMGLFYLLTVYCVMRGFDAQRGRLWSVAAVAACSLGMGSKAVMVTAPVMALLYDRVFLSGSFEKALRRRTGLYAGLAATWGVLIACGVVQRVLNPSPDDPAAVGFGVTGTSPIAYLLTQSGVVLHYLRLSFWPHPLCLDYGWPIATTVGAVMWPGALVIFLMAGTLWGLSRNKWWGFAGGWFFLILAPTSSIVPIDDVAFEHRMYLSLAGVMVLVVVSVGALLARVFARQPSGAAVRPVVGATLLIAAAGGLGYGTVMRNAVYKNDFDMWSDVLVQRPESARAHFSLGNAWKARGNPDAAILAYRESIKRHPGYPSVHNNLGSVLLERGSYAKAIEALGHAVRLDPRYANAHYNLGLALEKAGKLMEAIEHFDRALELRPELPQWHYDLGRLLSETDVIDMAVDHFHEALRLRPDFPAARMVLGNALAKQGDFEGALSEYRLVFDASADLDPHLEASTHFNIANTLAKLGKIHEATTEYRETVRADPRYYEGFYGLGWALAQRGRTEDAIDAFREALRIKPDYAQARQALAAARERLQRPPPR